MPGAEHLRDSATLVAMLRRQREAGKLYGAICAAPAVALAAHGLLPTSVTCYPAPKFKEAVTVWSDDPVVHDAAAHCVTAQGPAVAIQFGLKLAELLVGKAKADEVATGMLC